MNLSAAPTSRQATIRPMLLDEVHAALAHQPLAGWRGLTDFSDFLRAEP